jgi:hypothetical protein
MNRSVDGHSVRPFGPQAINGFLTAVSGAVVHDPKDAMGGPIRLLPHDLSNETIHRGNPAFEFAASKDLCTMDIPRGQVGPGTVTEILVFYPCGAMGSRRQSWLFAAPGLNACLFIQAHHEVIWAQ